MLTAAVVVSVILAAALLFTAIRKLTRTPAIVAQYARAGVPESWLVPLAVVLLLAVAGLAVGAFWTPLALVTGAALTVYFAVAVGFHLRHGDARNAPMAMALGLLSIATVALRLAA